jgi:hypothetical protein
MSYVYAVSAIFLGFGHFLLGDVIYDFYKKKYVEDSKYGFKLQYRKIRKSAASTNENEISDYSDYFSDSAPTK